MNLVKVLDTELRVIESERVVKELMKDAFLARVS